VAKHTSLCDDHHHQSHGGNRHYRRSPPTLDVVIATHRQQDRLSDEPQHCSSTHCGRIIAPLAAATSDELAFTDLLEAIVDYSLAKRAPAGLQLHPLVQAAIRARHHAHDLQDGQP